MSDYPDRAIFVSYRREDTQWATTLLLDRLIGKFGKDAVFVDVDNLPWGEDYRQQLESALSECWLTVVVIGENWLTIESPEGQPRLFEEDDLLRTEIEVSLTRKIPVVPVTVGNARMPKVEQLPKSIEALAYRQGTELRGGAHVNQYIETLIKYIEEMLAADDPLPSIEHPATEEPAGEGASEDESVVEVSAADQAEMDDGATRVDQRLPQDLREELTKAPRSPDAQYFIGRRFLEGEGVERNMVEATKWFRRAAEQGYAKAEYELGLIYEFGRGVPYDHDKAVEWLRKAADNGVEAAEAFLGKSMPR